MIHILLGILTTLLVFAACKELKSLQVSDEPVYSYEKYFKDFVSEVDSLSKLTSEGKATTRMQLEKGIQKAKLAYKRIEFIFDYNHTKFSALNINGGAVYKIDEDLPENLPIEPNGLQALDELIFSDYVESEREQIHELSKGLQEAVHFIADSQSEQLLVGAKLIEAIRSGLIRVFTLGVTGFDTPGSGNAMEEAEESLASMKRAFFRFDDVSQKAARKQFKQVVTLFDISIDQVQNQSFEEFDRMEFLRKSINPLYKSLRDFALLAKIDSEPKKDHGHNYSSDNLFAVDFLNRSFYQELSYASLDNTDRIALGKTLFFDPILSNDLKMSCATCHAPDKAFSDGLPTSETNIKGRFTKRNSPTLLNATFSKRYFHDLRSANLERQIPHVFDSEEEFNLSFTEAIKRLEKSSTYRKLFKNAYEGIATRYDINRRSISNALAAYVNTLVSFNSPFDKYVRNETLEYSEEALRGFNLFMGKAACGTCHFAPTFNGTVPPFYIESESEVLGVTVGFDTLNPRLDEDLGRYANGRRWEKWPHFKYSFKTPSIRNIELTAPYMHNGSFTSLEEVMEFYNRGGGVGMGLKLANQTLGSDPLGLTKTEIEEIITFMKSLTDTTDMSVGVVQLPKFEHESAWNTRQVNY